MIGELILVAVMAGSSGAIDPADSLDVRPPRLSSAVRSGVPAPWQRVPPAPLAQGSEYDGWKVAGVDVRGVPRPVSRELRDGLELSGQPHWLVFRRRATFSPRLLASDLERTRLFLARNGYPAADVQPQFAARAGARALRVELRIDSGPRVIVSQDRTEAVPPALEAQARRILKLDPGEPFRDARVEQRVSRLLALLQEDGRARARVTTEITPVDSTHVDVLFRVVAGEVYRFGGQRVDGAPPNLASTVRQTIDIAPATPYSPGRLHRAEEGLRALDLFRRVEVTTADESPGVLAVVAHLAERTPRTLQAGVGYFTDEGPKASASWKHRNLFGGGRGGSLEGSASRYMQEVRGTLWKPVLFYSRTRGSVALALHREAEALYTLRSAAVELAAVYLQSASTTIRPSVTVSRVDIHSRVPLDSVFASPPRSLLTAGVRWTRSRLDDPIDPGRGTYAWAALEYGMPDLAFDQPYARAEAEGTAYRPLTPGTLLAGRLHAGMVLPAANALALLPDKRFYSGGAASMRGYGRRLLGPRDAQGRPIGGAALFESSLEYRFPLLGALQGAVFLDAAQVWEQRSEFLTRLALAAGPGVILRTPIGPARLDLGVVLGSPEAGEPRQVLQLQVGHGF